MRLAKSTLWSIITLLTVPVVSTPASGGVRHGPEHAKNVFHTTGFQTQNALYGDQNIVPAINVNWLGGSYDPVTFQPRFGTFEALEHLELVSNDSFTRLAHPAFPLHSVRVKKSDLFCGEGIRAYSGYIDIEARHLFFTFVESLNDPANDPVVIWISGGPGGASENGLFNYRAVGPCMMSDDGKLEKNPHTWVRSSNIIFIDQPVGVGFSYADFGEQIGRSELAAKDVTVFLSIFFEHFRAFRRNKFHFFGGSYAGRYIPLFASAVWDQNPNLIAAGLKPIEVDSVAIGNAFTDMEHMIVSFYDAGCTDASVPPFVEISKCVKMKQIVPRCRRHVQESCRKVYDPIGCPAAIEFCYRILDPLIESGRDIYNLTQRDCDILDGNCHPAINHLVHFLNKPDVQDRLGVDPGARNFSILSYQVAELFVGNLDMWSFDTGHYVEALLERGVRTLYFNGNQDAGFNEARREDWFVDNRPAGWKRISPLLSFAYVRGAGHISMMDKQVEVYTLVKRWLANEEL